MVYKTCKRCNRYKEIIGKEGICYGCIYEVEQEKKGING